MYIVLSAVLTGFVAVRILKGHWTRNPQYLAVAIVGSAVGAVLFHAGWPQYDENLVLPTIASFIGSALAVHAFDRLLGAE